jgi:hypothetical protein
MAIKLEENQRPWKQFLTESGVPIQTIQAVFGVLGVILYAFGRFASDRFYGTLQVTPEEVGLSFVSLILPAILVAGLLTLLILTVAKSLTIVNRLEVRLSSWVSSKGRPRTAERLTHVAEAVLTLGFYAIAVAIGIATRSLFWGAIALIVLYAGLSFADFNEPRRHRPLWIGVGTTLALLALLVMAWVSAYSLAARVKAGKEVSVNVAIQIPGLRAHRVYVQPVDKLPNGLKDRCMLRLGSSDGVVVLYDYQNDVVWRVTSEAVVLKGSCPDNAQG